MHYIDLHWVVMPTVPPHGFHLHWLDLAAPLAIGGVWLWMFFTELGKRPLFAAGDPYLLESLQSGGSH